MKGIHPVIECTQNIPCNPCRDACHFGCIHVSDKITDLPELVENADCQNCGMCVAACPGQAIFLVNEDCGDGCGSVTIPYEFLPLPRKGDRGQGLDRSGKAVCEAEVTEVRESGVFDHTRLVTLKVPAEMAMKVRFYKAGELKG